MPPNIFILRCLRCDAVVSRPIRLLLCIDDLNNVSFEDQYAPPNLVPEGYFVPSERVAEKLDIVYAPKEHLILHTADTIHHPTLTNTNDMGCCGYQGNDYNIFCVNGHTVGTETSDCCVTNYAHFSLSHVYLEEVISSD
jgi:hypothetical protein